jgi:hypothetical protein
MKRALHTLPLRVKLSHVRSALYYPFTSIQSEELIRTSLLLWDRVHVMVPWGGFGRRYGDRDHARALELIGEEHVPTYEEKKQAHEIVEDFATRPLPEAFSYAPKGDLEDWPVYRDKLLPETWEILKNTGRAGHRSFSPGVPVTEPTGLSLLSILADCCAGESLARITDASAAYVALAGLLIEKPKDDELRGEMEGLAALTLSVIDTKQIPLTKLISFREREEKSAGGHNLRALRHRYLECLSKQAAALAASEKESDRAELTRQFREDMDDDLRHLREELGFSAKEVITSKELLASVVFAGPAVAAQFVNVATAVTASGGMLSLLGLLAMRTKFVKSRRDVLRNHPMAYLYELKGGLRI